MKQSDFLKTFTAILNDAAEMFGRPPSKVNIEQWTAVARGRASISRVRIFGYARLRDCVAPDSSASKKEQKDMRALIARLVKSA